MTGEPTEGSLAVKADQLALQTEAAGILGVKLVELGGWNINFIDPESGFIDAHIPIEMIDVKDVPTVPRNVEYVKGLMEKHATKHGGTGQQDPGVICHVPGEEFYLADGFHRHEAQTDRGITTLRATVEPNCTYDDVIERRLQYAKDHDEVEFSRQVDWMQSNWERTPWHEEVPNVLTAFRALDDGNWIEDIDEEKLIEGLSDEVYAGVCQWVEEKSQKWDMTPKQIRERLAQAESFDRDLMQFVYVQPGALPPNRISLKHVDAIRDQYPGEGDLQRVLVDTIMEHKLSDAATRLLIERIIDQGAVTDKQMQQAIGKIDLEALQVETRAKSRQRSRPKSNGANLEDASTQDLLALLEKRLVDPDSDAEWTETEAESALQVTFGLSEYVIDLIEQQGTAVAGHLGLLADLGALGDRFTELSERVDTAPEEKGTEDDKLEAAPDPTTNGSNGNRPGEGISDAATAESAEEVIRTAHLAYLTGKTEKHPRLASKEDVQRARGILEHPDRRWNKNRRAQLDKDVDGAEERIQAMADRRAGRVHR